MHKSIGSTQSNILNKQNTKEIISGFFFCMVKINIQKVKEFPNICNLRKYVVFVIYSFKLIVVIKAMNIFK